MRPHLTALVLLALSGCLGSAMSDGSAMECPQDEAPAPVPDGGVAACGATSVTLVQDPGAPGCLRDPLRPGQCLPNPDGCRSIVVAQQGFAAAETCELPSGQARVRRGALALARCTDHLDADGAPCRVCATTAGDVVSDGCHRLPVEGGLRCETLEAAGGATCRACTPGGGGAVVLRHRCVPAGVDPDRCTPFEDPARGACADCRDAQGALVATQCEPPAPDPATRRCRRLELAAGAGATAVCRLCLDADSRVTEYTCAVQDPAAPPLCASFQDAAGASCTVCQDPHTGLELSRRCTPSPAPAVLCATLADFAGGPRCEVCQDAEGALMSRRCSPAGCLPGSASAGCAAAPAACELREAGPQGVCDRCGDANGDGRVDDGDWRCTTASGAAVDLACALEAGAAGGTCRVCRDGQGVERSRACDGHGAAPAAHCATLALPGVAACTLCTDAIGNVIDNRCGPALACTAEPLSRADGSRATCSRCAEATAACASPADCGPGQECGPGGCTFPGALANAGRLRQASCWDEGAAPCGLGADGQATCQDGAGVWMAMLPGACGNPWEEWFAAQGGALPVDAADQGELLRRWLAEARGVSILGHRLDLAVAPLPPQGCAGCGCPRGESLAVLAPAGSLVALLRLGFVPAP